MILSIRKLSILIPFAFVLTPICTAAQNNFPTTTPPLLKQAEEVASRLEGVMDTSAQAIANPKKPNVTMTTCQVNLVGANNQRGSILLYQEQALSNELNKPYRQRFLQLKVSTFTQSIESQAWKPQKPEIWVNFCNKPEQERNVKAKDIGNRVCSVFLKINGEHYIGNTPPTGCPTNVRGAVKTTNQIFLYKDKMETWDRGFDANGKQIWGAKTDAYIFRKRPTNNQSS